MNLNRKKKDFIKAIESVIQDLTKDKLFAKRLKVGHPRYRNGPGCIFGHVLNRANLLNQIGRKEGFEGRFCNVEAMNKLFNNVPKSIEETVFDLGVINDFKELWTVKQQRKALIACLQTLKQEIKDL